MSHPGPPFTWAELREWRWGPAKNDPAAGFDIVRPDASRRLIANCKDWRNDAYARAEREAMQAENDLIQSKSD